MGRSTYVIDDDEELDEDGVPVRAKEQMEEEERRKPPPKKEQTVKIRYKKGDLRFTRVIPREEWGALPPKPDHKMQPLIYPIIHVHMNIHRNWYVCRNQAECSETLKRMQMREMNENGIDDVRHNFMIGYDGNVYEGRGWNYRPEAADRNPKNWMGQTVDIGLFGETQDDNSPYGQMLLVAYDFIQHLVKIEKILPTWTAV